MFKNLVVGFIALCAPAEIVLGIRSGDASLMLMGAILLGVIFMYARASRTRID